MKQLPDTPPSLIARIQEGDDDGVWAEFLEIYGPIVFGFLRRKGLQAANGEDVTQEVFRTVARQIGDWEHDPAKGKFRNWLFVIVRSRLIDHLRKEQQEPQGSGDDNVQAMLEATPDDDSELWATEHKTRLLNWAADKIENEFDERAWECFRRTAIDGEKAKAVGDALGMSVSHVYVTKSRIIARLREVVQEIEGD